MVNQSNYKVCIAVLPFVNMSSDPENEYFSDGITEELLNALSKVDEIMVTARTSSFMFKGKNEDIRDIGRKLGVSIVIEGSVRKAGNKVRITTQIINSLNGFHIWSENFDRDLNDIFAIQDEISLIIAEKIRENIGHFNIQDHLVRNETSNIEAYNIYLKGRYHLNNHSAEEVGKAIKYFEEAQKLDDKYAMTYIGLAQAYGTLASQGYIMPEEAFFKAKNYALKAIELNDKLPEPYVILGLISFFADWNFKTAIENLNHAIENHPNHSEARQVLATVLVADNRLDEAKKQIDIALKIDPISITNKIHNAGILLYSGHLEEVLEIYEELIESNPYNEQVHIGYGIINTLMGNYDKAIELFNNVPANLGQTKKDIGNLGYVLVKMGQIEEAEKIVKMLSNAINNGEAWAVKAGGEVINILIAMGRYEEAIDVIERGIKMRAPGLIYSKANIFYDPLRKFERFQKATEIIVSGGLTNMENQPEKYIKSKLKDSESKKYAAQLEDFMTKWKPHLDNNLSLKDLAVQLGMSANQLSQLLNDTFHKNYYDFINGYRLDEFIKRYSDPKNRNFTMLSVAYDCGFNSKTTFNTFFKRITGQTPTEYFK